MGGLLSPYLKCTPKMWTARVGGFPTLVCIASNYQVTNTKPMKKLDCTTNYIEALAFITARPSTRTNPSALRFLWGARPALRLLLLCLYPKECLKSVLRALLAAGEWTWLNFQCPPPIFDPCYFLLKLIFASLALLIRPDFCLKGRLETISDITALRMISRL